VADGTYYPDEGSNLPSVGSAREYTFRLRNNLVIYGGFVGGQSGETDKQQRNPAVNITILSGEIQQDSDISNNSFHIVTAVKVNNTSVIDGFTIIGGNADGAEAPDYPDIDDLISDEVGAGMLLLGKHTLSSSDGCWPLVMRCRFEDNQAEYGAAVFHTANQVSNPIFGNCEFHDNHATIDGAGFYNADQVNGDVQGGMGIFVNCLFVGNQAADGAAIWCGTYAGVELHNCTIADNEATGGGNAAAIAHTPRGLATKHVKCSCLVALMP
jgi:hypothetical protein